METNEEFRELEKLEKIVIPNSLRQKLGIEEKEKLHIQVKKDNEKTITLRIEKCGKAC